MKCRLCLVNEANKSGAHIFSHALISKCVNVPNGKGRDKELMIGYSATGETDLYFGSAVSPEIVEKALGRAYEDADAKNNINDIVRDNEFCSVCESLFGIIESSFSKTLKAIREKGLGKISNCTEIRLYFLIQAWRASACNYNDWKLSANFEEKIRILVYQGCKTFQDDIPQEIVIEINEIPMILTFLETPIGDESSNLLVITNDENPYLLFMCDFILQLFENKPKGIELPSLYTINENVIVSEINIGENFKIDFVDNEKRKIIIRLSQEGTIKEILNKIYLFFLEYCHKNNILPIQADLSQYLIEVTNIDEVGVTELYSIERQEAILNTMFKK